MSIIVETHDLAIGYRIARKPDLVVAAGLSLQLNAGELVGVLGPNGAGKSTLMRTLAGMQPALGGSITIGGNDLAALRPEQWAARLSVVLTERPNLGLLNGYAVVALGRHPYTNWTGRLNRYDEAVIRWAVEAVGADDIADRPVMELSDGQRQKLMIARALAQESEVILLDEPTAYLDLPRRAEIMHLLRHLAADTGRAILLSTHDLDLALRTADTLWLMAEGAIRVGMPEDLVLNGSFEAAFASAGVTFDRETGSFSVHRHLNRSAAVVGHGIAHTWTRRALKRAGFALVRPDQCPIVIEINADHKPPVWYLHRGDRQTTHHTIHDLLHTLAPTTEDNYDD